MSYLLEHFVERRTFSTIMSRNKGSHLRALNAHSINIIFCRIIVIVFSAAEEAATWARDTLKAPPLPLIVSQKMVLAQSIFFFDRKWLFPIRRRNAFCSSKTVVNLFYFLFFNASELIKLNTRKEGFKLLENSIFQKINFQKCQTTNSLGLWVEPPYLFIGNAFQTCCH